LGKKKVQREMRPGVTPWTVFFVAQRLFLMHVCGWFGGYGGWNMHAIPFDTAVSCYMVAVSCLCRLQWSCAIQNGRSSQVPGGDFNVHAVMQVIGGNKET
jgi:hypothetical protein